MTKRRGLDLKTWSKYNAPEEMWFEILTRVPAKFALKCRAVATSWRAIIDHPHFTRLHLLHFHHNLRETYLLAVHGIFNHQEEWIVRFSKNLRTNAIQVKPPQEKAPYTAVSSIHGLVMLMRLIPNAQGAPDLVLWNPSIGATRTLPLRPLLPAGPSDTRYFDFGLGFDTLVEDYKFVTFLVGRKGVERVAVYTLGTGSWNMTLAQGDGFVYTYAQRSYCIRGVLYCIALDVTVGYFKLISFDLNTGVYGATMLPNNQQALRVSHSYYHSQSLSLIDGGNSLALIDMSRPNGSVWASDSVVAADKSFTWTRRHIFPTVFAGYEQIPVVFYCLRKMDEEELFLKAHNIIISYNLKTHEQKIVLKKDLRLERVWPYMESLLLRA